MFTRDYAFCQPVPNKLLLQYSIQSFTTVSHLRSTQVHASLSQTSITHSHRPMCMCWTQIACVALGWWDWKMLSFPLKWMCFYDQCQYKILNNDVILPPDVLPKVSPSRTRTYNVPYVGEKNQLFEPRSRLMSTERSFFYAVPKLWNRKVSTAQASASNLEAFKLFFINS